jgi:HdeA/HdeB family
MLAVTPRGSLQVSTKKDSQKQTKDDHKMKLLTTLALIALMTTAAWGAEQKIDLSAMTCGDFMKSDQAKSTLILAWFLGFYGEEEDPQVIDLDKLEHARTQFTAFCQQQPSFRMTVAAEGILETPEQQSDAAH